MPYGVTIQMHYARLLADVLVDATRVSVRADTDDLDQRQRLLLPRKSPWERLSARLTQELCTADAADTAPAITKDDSQHGSKSKSDLPPVLPDEPDTESEHEGESNYGEEDGLDGDRSAFSDISGDSSPATSTPTSGSDIEDDGDDNDMLGHGIAEEDDIIYGNDYVDVGCGCDFSNDLCVEARDTAAPTTLPPVPYLHRQNSERAARSLHHRINAVLDRIVRALRVHNADDARAEIAVRVLERCSALPDELKLLLLARSVAKRCTTDAMLRCFLTKHTSSATIRQLVRSSAAPHLPVSEGALISIKEELQCDDTDSDSSLCATDAARRLMRLSLRECQGVTDTGLSTVCGCCPALQQLDLTGCRGVSACGLQRVVRSCCDLGELLLSECPAVTDKTVPVIFRYHSPPHIRSLSVRSCVLHDTGLACLASYCPTLQKLDVRCCGLLTATGFEALTQRVPSLRLFAGGRCIGLDDAALACVARGFGESLTELNLEMCWRVSSAGVAQLAQHCTRLCSLNLSSCALVDDAALRSISRSPGLQQSLVRISLDECNVGDDALEELVANCASLAFISVTGCPRVTFPRAYRLAQLSGVQIVVQPPGRL